MGDFSQIGPVPTLHRLGDRPIEDLERELAAWSRDRPMVLVIPTLFEGTERRALDRIVDELVEVPYLDRVVIGLDHAGPDTFAEARRFFDRLPMDHRVLWQDGPSLQALDADLDKLGLAPPNRGKGRNLWYCLGYLLASGDAAVIGFHDADIVTYSRSLLARLLYPVAHPRFGYRVAKGYYDRTDGVTLNGRVARLLVVPLVRALGTVVGPTSYLDFLASFRYPLAGELAIRREVAADLVFPADWGVEIGVLGEVFDRLPRQQVCQVEIADGYDHKHQPLSADDPGDGLHKMAIDIGRVLFQQLAADGIVLSAGVLRSIEAAYRRAAAELVEIYHHDALLNGLHTAPHAEAEMVEVFARAVVEAGDAFLRDPAIRPSMASWTRVVDAMPEVLDRLVEAVGVDEARA